MFTNDLLSALLNLACHKIIQRAVRLHHVTHLVFFPNGKNRVREQWCSEADEHALQVLVSTHIPDGSVKLEVERRELDRAHSVSRFHPLQLSTQSALRLRRHCSPAVPQRL